MYTLNNFYTSNEWKAFRKVVIFDRLDKNGDTICEYCGKPITNAYDIILHHKEYLTEQNVNDAAVALNPDNIALVHHACHNRIHNKLGGNHVRQVFLVWGCPMSGKSYYVDSVAGYGDLIVDIDNIWSCVSGLPKYEKPDKLKSVVFGLRDSLMDMVKFRLGWWSNAYVIGGYPLVGERERLIKTLGAREIYIDSTKDECIKRLELCSDGRNVNEWKKYIDDWWRKANISPPGQ